MKRNFWVFSAGLAVAWAVVLILSAVIGGEHRLDKVLPVFAGFAIGWVATTIARYVYPPPARWTK